MFYDIISKSMLGISKQTGVGEAGKNGGGDVSIEAETWSDVPARGKDQNLPSSSQGSVTPVTP